MFGSQNKSSIFAHWNDLMKKDLLPELKYKTFEDGLETF